MSAEEARYFNRTGFCCLRNIPKQTQDLYLVHCGMEECTPGHCYGPVERPEYHLHFIISGKGTYKIQGKTYRLHRGQIFLVPKGVATQYCADREDPWHYCWVSFDGDKTQTYLAQTGISETEVVRDTFLPPEQFLDLVRDMLNANELTLANELKRVGDLFQLMALLMDSWRLSTHPSSTPLDYPGEVYVECAIKYIQYHYDRIKVSDIAEYIGINRSYFSNIFKKKMNVTPQEYLMNYRLEMAAQLLETTSLSIRDVALRVGYKDSLGFSKVFRRAYGAAPRSYRAGNYQH